MNKRFVILKMKQLWLVLVFSTMILAVFSAKTAFTKDSDVFTIDRGVYGGELAVPLNKSQFLKIHKSFNELTVGNPAIADVVALSDQSLYILGKKTGSTNLSIRDDNGNIISVIDIIVTYDIEGLKAKMAELAPGDVIEVRPAGSSIVLGGRVASADRLRQLMLVAEQYAPGKVTNMLSVSGSQQVLLKVRFAEVQRSVLKDIGFSNTLTYSASDSVFTAAAGDGINPEAFASGVANVVSGDFTLLSIIDVLEEKGMVRTLAEPNIIALSGKNATFLAGGEFPIPVAQDSDDGGSTITVEFKEFGVGLSFTPTVLSGDTINLELNTEVSSIDSTVSVSTDSLIIPGLKVRRANTTVELRDGQSFAIAGLIQDDFADTIRAIPGISDLPILGALSRSTDFLRRQTELVIIVKVHLVQPTTGDALAMPTDRSLPPTEFDLFMLGNIEKEAVLEKAAGIDGPYGYILP